MSNISDFTFSYSLAKKYVTTTFKLFYSVYIVVGKENIPVDCPVIFAPNHTNALMDALAVASLTPYKMPVVFLARSDIFRNKTAAKILNFAKIMPAFRMRDGVENLGRNSEIFDRCVEVLHKNKALCIMPEGNQEIERRLRPLAKGIFRIAFAAQQKYGNQPAVKIIPVGLDFGSIVKSQKHIIINIGKPIEVSDYIADYENNPVSATNDIRERLKNDLIQNSLHLDTDQYYECFETAIEIGTASYLNKMQLPDKPIYRFVARQKLAQKLVELEKENPITIQELDLLCTEYSKVLNETNLRNWTVEQAPFNNVFLFFEGLFIILTFPFFLWGLALNFLPFFIPVYLRKNIFKPEFSGFYSSLHYTLGAITFPLFYTLESLLFTCFAQVSPWTGVLFFLSLYPLGKWALKWNSTYKKFRARIRYNKLSRSNHPAISEAQILRNKIIDLLQ
ncbi:MAG: 1-acyl-sn-glycerol-3-phosphate acyltransferase [Paludibacter sp.]